jgi:hypothetical protein
MTADPHGEIGPQRRMTRNGRPLHCCCICGVLAPWADGWSCFTSIQEIENCEPYPKFCSPACRRRGGPDAQNVTQEMKRAAKEQEWRAPKPVYERRSYHDALAEQKRRQRVDEGMP